jgi:hypothetical protein
MPNYKSHLHGGFFVFSLLLLVIIPTHYPSLCTAAEWLLFSLAGSLFPDIDIKSKGERYFYWLLLMILLLLATMKRFVALTVTSIFAMVPMISKHRGLFHRSWFIIGGPALLWYGVSCYYHTFAQAFFFDMVFFVAGALSHLWLDLGIRKMFRI